jgi:hypothetical protein
MAWNGCSGKLQDTLEVKATIFYNVLLLQYLLQEAKVVNLWRCPGWRTAIIIALSLELTTMSRPPPRNIVEWFQQNYPREYDLQEEVTRRAEDIFRQIPLQRTPGNPVPIRIELVDRPEGGLTLAMNELGIVYLGALSRAILESLTSQLEGLLSSGIGDSIIRERIREVLRSESGSSPHVSTSGRRCQNCQADNDLEARFCDQCGRQLEQ